MSARIQKGTRAMVLAKMNQEITLAVVHLVCTQGWPWARARWATAPGLISKLGLIPKFFKAFIILKDLKK